MGAACRAFPKRTSVSRSLFDQPRRMPNRYQLAFLLSFFSVFALLVLSFHLFTNWLDSIGYPIGNLILIGIDSPPKMASGRVEIEKIPGQVIDFVKNFTLDDAKSYLTQEKLLELSKNPAVVVAAILTGLWGAASIAHAALVAASDPGPYAGNASWTRATHAQWAPLALLLLGAAGALAGAIAARAGTRTPVRSMSAWVKSD